MFAAAEGDFADAERGGLLQSFAHDGEGFGLGVVFGCDEVGAVEERLGQLIGFDELVNLHGGGGGEAEGLELVGIDLDVLVAGVLVALDDVGLVDFAGIVDVAVVDALVGAAIDEMEFNLAGRIGGGEDADGDGDDGDLNGSGPGGTCGHCSSFENKYELGCWV